MTSESAAIRELSKIGLKPYRHPSPSTFLSVFMYFDKGDRKVTSEAFKKIKQKYDSVAGALPEQLVSAVESKLSFIGKGVESYFTKVVKAEVDIFGKDGQVEIFCPGTELELVSVWNPQLMNKADSLLQNAGYKRRETHPDGTACYRPKV